LESDELPCSNDRSHGHVSPRLGSLRRGDSLNRFGFAGKEIFPIDHQISHLRAADLDGNGLQDLVVVNNSRSRINLLFNQNGQTNLSSGLKSQARNQRIASRMLDFEWSLFLPRSAFLHW
jgi:hypothetical protein